MMMMSKAADGRRVPFSQLRRVNGNRTSAPTDAEARQAAAEMKRLRGGRHINIDAVFMAALRIAGRDMAAWRREAEAIEGETFIDTRQPKQ